MVLDHNSRSISREDVNCFAQPLPWEEPCANPSMEQYVSWTAKTAAIRKSPEGKEMLVLYAHPRRRNLLPLKRSRPYNGKSKPAKNESFGQAKPFACQEKMLCRHRR